MDIASKYIKIPSPLVNILNGHKNSLTVLLSKIAAKKATQKDEGKKGLMVTYYEELSSAVNVLSNHIDDCYCKIEMASGCQTLETKELNTLSKAIQDHIMMHEHHNTAAKAVKIKFTSILEHV